MRPKDVVDPAFSAYGRVIAGLDFSELFRALRELPCPADRVIYRASEPALERLPVCAELQDRVFGELPIQLGYCNGSNRRLDALEYHRSSEADVAATDLILMLGRVQEITPGYTYDTAKLESFFVPAGTAVELYATTLHYAPGNAGGEGFRMAVVLPLGTNTDLAAEHPKDGEDRLIAAKNKWLITHPGAHLPGSWAGLVGANPSF